MTATTEYDRTKNEAALVRAKLGLPAKGSVGKPGQAALAVFTDARTIDGASFEDALEAARARLADFDTAGAPGARELVKEAARELAEERRKAKAKEEAERQAAEREHYGVGQATKPASTPTPAASAKPKDAPTEPTEKAPTPAKPGAAKMTPASAPAPADVDDALLLRLDDDDAGNADALEARHGGSFAYTGALGWLQYTGQCWADKGAAASINLAAKDTLRLRRIAAVKAGKREALIAAAKPSSKNISAAVSLFRDMRTVDTASFDTERHLLNCANGVLDLKSGKLEAHEPSQLFTYCIETPYDASASRDAWLSFLRGSIDGGEEAVTWLQAWLGYGITGETNLDQFLYVHGPTRAGKGTLTTALHALLGRPLAAEISYATLTAKRTEDTQNFDLAPLRPARLLVCEEANPKDALNSALLKKMTGGNLISAAFKGKTGFFYAPQFKLIAVSNRAINMDVDDGAAWARARVVEFPTSHEGEEDFGYRAYISSPAVLRGALAWLVEGAARYYRYGKSGIPTPASVRASTTKARDALDSVGRWLTERAKPEAEAWTANGAAYADYSTWAKDEDVEAKPMASFTHALRAKGFAIGVAKWHENRTQKGISGFTLKA